MGLDELARERQSEAERRFLAAPLGGPVKPVEHPRLVGGGDPPAIVGDDDLRALLRARCLEQDAAAFVGVGEGIAELPLRLGLAVRWRSCPDPERQKPLPSMDVAPGLSPRDKP